MIYIEERETTKMPGETSLYISFDFSQDIVNEIKSLDSYYYNKKTHEFEIPTLLLSNIIDSLCKYDEIQLTVLQDKQPCGCDTNLLCNYKLNPLPHQIDGIKYGLSHERFLLLDQPGLGKTAQIIHIAEELYERGEIEHCLIICGVNTLKSNWRSEIEKHSYLDCTILGEKVSKRGRYSIGSVKERVEHLYRKIDEFFVITNVETIRSDEIVSAILTGPNEFGMIAVDEIHCCKSTQSLQGSNLLKLTKSRHRVGATGTLILNNPLDTYLPLKWIGVEKSSLTQFKNYYCTFGGQFHNILIGFKHLDSLKQQIENHSIRRMKDMIDLPPKVVINELVDMGEQQEKFYSDVERGIVDEVDKVKLTTSSLLAMVTRLRQATACPSILTTQQIESAKISRACDLVEQIVGCGKKVIVFSTFKETVNVLATKLKDFGVVSCTGDTNDQDIETNKKLFMTDDTIKVFIATWQKLGTGQTLTAASYAIFIDTPWTAAVYNQAQDRVHRIGAKESVTIYNLVTKGTIDERVLEILEDKEAIGDFIVDDKLNDKSMNSLKKYIEDLR